MGSINGREIAKEVLGLRMDPGEGRRKGGRAVSYEKFFIRKHISVLQGIG